MKIFLLLLSLFYTWLVFGQDFSLGSWREYLPYRSVKNIVHIGTKHYASTDYAVYFLDEEDNSINRLNKINALSDFDINTMGKNTQEETIIIGYNSGNIDLIKNETVVNLSGIVTSNIIGDKAIYNLHSKNNLTYLACGFGIVVLDVERQEVKDTYIIGLGGMQVKINDITTSTDSIFAATDSGVYTASLNSPFLSDPNSWSKITNIPNLKYSLITIHGGGLLLNAKYSGYRTDTIYRFVNGNAFVETSLTENDYYSFESNGENLLIASQRGIIEIDQNFQEQNFLYTYNNTNLIAANFCNFYDGNYWIGDQNKGMVKVQDNYHFTSFLIQGPYSNEAFHMATSGNHLWVAVGATEGTGWNSTYNMRGAYHYNQENWEMFNLFTVPELSEVDSIYDYVYTSIDPKDPTHVFVSSFKGGVIELKNGQFVKRHTWYNSSLQRRLTDLSKTCVAGSDFDKDGNLWISNSYVNEPLSVYTTDGIWKSFVCSPQTKGVVCTDVMIDKTNGYIWFAADGGGLMVYDFNQTPLDETDDRYKMLTTAVGNGGLPSNVINTIVEDKNGEIWIGTEHGPVVIYNPQSIFEGGDYDVQEVLINQDGVLQVLLETEDINEIVVDGANRKWFATEGGGVFLMSEDATKMIHAFTTENSPLFSNKVMSLAINPITGEVYIGTDRGIMAYKGEATEANKFFENVYAYPNPVRPGYNGKIGIRGLTENAEVKITDANGNLVQSTVSLGGQAVWDGKTLEGERVATGIYYVFVVSKDGSQKIATKIMFVN